MFWKIIKRLADYLLDKKLITDKLMNKSLIFVLISLGIYQPFISIA